MGALGALLGLGPDGVRAAERRGQLPAAEQTPGGHRRWDLRAVAAFLERKGRAVPARLAAAIGGGASIPPASPPPAPEPAPGPYQVEVPPGGASIGGVIVRDPGAYMIWPGKLPAAVVAAIQAIPAPAPAIAPVAGVSAEERARLRQIAESLPRGPWETMAGAVLSLLVALDAAEARAAQAERERDDVRAESDEHPTWCKSCACSHCYAMRKRTDG